MQSKTIQPRFVFLVLSTALGLLSTKADANPEAQAPQDDILEVIDLPLAADLANQSGIAEEELQASVEVARNGGMGAAVLSEVLVAEADAVKIRGKKKGLPDWLLTRWASGVRGVDLKSEVKARPEQAKLDPAKRKELQESIKKHRKERQKERKALALAIKEQRKAGKPVKLRGKSAHARLKQSGRAKPGHDKHEQGQEAGHEHEPGKAMPDGKPAKPGKAKSDAKHAKSGKPGNSKQGKPGKAGRTGHPAASKHGAGKGKAKSKKKGRGKH